MKLFITLVFVIGLIGFLGVFSFQQILSISLATGSTNFYLGAPKAVPTSVMTIRSCTPGKIPGLPGIFGEISAHPANVKIQPSGKLRIINADSNPHTFGVAFTKVWEEVPSGESLEISYGKIPKSGSWGVTCDGIYLGENSPTIVILEL